MAITHGDRVLRLITVLTWVPAMTLLIIFGVKSNQAIPPLGLIPMTFSAVFGLFKIYSHAKNHGFTIFMDTSLAIFIFALFTPGIVLVRQYSHWWIGSAVENAILGTFGLSTLLINFTIHVFFVLRETPIITWLGRIFSSPKCPHCQRDLRLLWDMSSNGSSTHSNESKHSYVAVERECAEVDHQAGPSGTSTPRPSTDDETASFRTLSDERDSFVTAYQ